MHVVHPLVKANSVESRLYQEEIFAEASKANTLVVLPTALGKTIIALLLAAQRLEKFGGKILFLAPTKPLVQQHMQSFSSKLLLPADAFAILTGNESPDERASSFAASKIIFATPQSVRNDVLAGRIALNDVSLIIFDEAHHAVGSYAYVELAKAYRRDGKNQLVLALTASPGTSKEEIAEVCKNLFIEQIKSKHDSDADVAAYVPKLDMSWKTVDVPEEFLKVKKLLENVLRANLRALKAAGFLDSAEVATVNRRTLLAARMKILSERKPNYNAMADIAAAIKLVHAIDLLETQGTSALKAFFEKMKGDKSKSSRTLYTVEDFRMAVTMVSHLAAQGIDHPKLVEMLAMLKQQPGQSIVFANYRSQVKKIVRLLGDAGISAAEFVGQKEGFSQKKQKEVVDSFRAGSFRVLVATSVAEEGIDIPSVDFVLFYEPVPSAIRWIQRRGRTARKNPGRVLVLMAKGTRDEAFYWISQRKEASMHSELGKVKLAKYDANQKTLAAFAAPSDEGLIYADSREVPSGLLEKLREQLRVEIRQLEVGDFLISDRLAVERKTAKDFVNSLIDGRLFSQARELADNFEKPILILEGGDLYSQRNIHPNSIRGALASLGIDFGVTVLPSRDIEETAELIRLLAKREQGRPSPPGSPKRKAVTTSERQEAVAASLPRISSKTAKKLLLAVGTLESLFSSDEEKLRKIDGIGKKKAKELKELFSAPYRESE